MASGIFQMNTLVSAFQRLVNTLGNHKALDRTECTETVSFLTYLLKSFADYIKQYEEIISRSLVNLLATCSNSVSIRKELLVALKHVLGTDFKCGLLPLIDTLLDESYYLCECLNLLKPYDMTLYCLQHNVIDLVCFPHLLVDSHIRDNLKTAQK